MFSANEFASLYIRTGIAYMGVIASDEDIPDVYSAGQVWEVGISGVYKGHLCERGDLVIAMNSSGGERDNREDFKVYGSIDELDEDLNRIACRVEAAPEPEQYKSTLDVISAIL